MKIYVLILWDNNIHWYTWRNLAAGNGWGIYGYNILNIEKSGNTPTVTTGTSSATSSTTATSGGKVTSAGGAAVTARGVCWSINLNPTVDLITKTSDGTGTGIFTSNIVGLTANTTYHVRAYATNSAGTTYGGQRSFTTLNGGVGTVTDIDGNVYNTVIIGTQVWMVGNLQTTRYRNGDLIGTTNPATQDIISESTPKYQWAYDGNSGNVASYGRLYTWYALNDSRNICPAGWHVPADDEWTSLTDYLGGLSLSGGKLKEVGYAHWDGPNTGATDETGFTALPAGYRMSSGSFGGISSDGLWWSSTEGTTNDAWNRGMGNTYSDVYRNDNSKRSGYSVRCLQGGAPTGIDNIQNDGISIFPNPVSGMLNIEYKNDSFKSINILNSQGGLMAKEKAITPRQQFDFTRFEPGLYILEFVKTSGEKSRLKVIRNK